ncbi:hypothetical protein [Effusibacillus consociatus]
MKKILALAFVATMSLGGTALAAGPDVAECAQMEKGQCVAMCAQDMNRGVSQCAISSEQCPMNQ